MKYYKNQSGQSLVEFIVIAPLFFIVLSGVLFLSHLQTRHFIDDQTQTSLQISQFLFSSAERQQAQWSQSALESQHALGSVADASFHPSLAYPSAKNKNQGVFADKKHLQQGNSSDCLQSPSYQVSAGNNEEFSLSTCSSKNGYENSSFAYDGVLSSLGSAHYETKGVSFFAPEQFFSWENRPALAVQDSKSFFVSLSGYSFSAKYASLLEPAQKKTFNQKIFMEAFQPANGLVPYSRKFNRAAKEGANMQLAECFAEVAVECVAATVAYPACLAEGAADIVASITVGKKSMRCPVANGEIQAASAYVNTRVLFKAGVNAFEEGKMRKNFF